MKHMNIPAFKYWLRIHGYRLERFGTGQRVIRLRLNQKGNETKNKKKDVEIPI